MALSRAAAMAIAALLLAAGCSRPFSTPEGQATSSALTPTEAPSAEAEEDVEAPAEPEPPHPSESRGFVPGSHLGALGADTSEKQLIEIYGDANVARSEWSLGEGEMRPATVAFKGKPDEFWVIWKDDRYLLPERVFIVGPAWRSGAGLQIGTDLRSLVKINGGDFDFLGFDWDYSGAVTSWRGGRLAPEAGKLSVFLERNSGATDEALEAAVLGDRSVESSQPGLEALGIRVRRIDLVF